MSATRVLEEPSRQPPPEGRSRPLAGMDRRADTTGMNGASGARGPRSVRVAVPDEAVLLGRAPELEQLSRILEHAPKHGDVLVIRGEAGIGKSVLLTQAGEAAAERGMLVLRTVGSQAEANLPFAGLHQLLRPVLGHIDQLPAVQGHAMRLAFGFEQGALPERFLIALAALELLSEAAVHQPVVMIIDDAHWLDRPTAEVLAFVGRRLEADPIVLLAGHRDGYDSTLLGTGLAELHLRGLSEAQARQLLDARYPDLGSGVGERVLALAAGNPLALLELPAALGDASLSGEVTILHHLPLSSRLERAFAARGGELPDTTRRLLLVAAADGGAVLTEVMRAVRIMDGAEPSVEDLVPAVRAQLVSIDGPRLRFRHPLVGSAIYQAASVSERHAAHGALAQVLGSDHDRSAWHRAAAAVGMDAEVASELEQAARRARRRGAIMTAGEAFRRAAGLTPDPAQRGVLLVSAAEAASELGRSAMQMRLLREAGGLELRARERAEVMGLQDAFRPGPAGDPAQVSALARAAAEMADAGETQLALSLLSSAAFRCYWGNVPGPAVDEVLAVADRLEVPPDHPWILQIQAYSAPIDRAPAVLGYLPSTVPSADADALYWFGSAACLVGAFELAADLLGASATQLREQGRLRNLAQVLHTGAWSAVMSGEFGHAMTQATEADRLAGEMGRPLWQTSAWISQAALAAIRGDGTLVEQLTARAESVGLPIGAAGLLGLAQWARGLFALGQGRHAEAYDQLIRLYRPGDPACHRMVASYAIGDLVEVATRCGREQEARALLAELLPVAESTRSPYFLATARYGRCLLADDSEAEACFEDALRDRVVANPFLYARVQMALGEWLRRHRRAADSRPLLRAARDAFDALGSRPWADRARKELRASGETSRKRTPSSLDELTPQELQIIQLAASGLSNREIGQRLYLSHRTVESHLYRVFPKLGVSSRAQLAAAVDGVLAVPAAQ